MIRGAAAAPCRHRLEIGPPEPCVESHASVSWLSAPAGWPFDGGP